MNWLDSVIIVLCIASLVYIGYYVYIMVFGVILQVTKIAKGSKVIAPKPLSYCGDNKEMNAGLCYDKCRDGYKRSGLLCEPDVYGIGIGTPVELEDCPPGWRTDPLTCWKG